MYSYDVHVAHMCGSIPVDTPYPYQRFQHIMVYHLFVWDSLRTREFNGIDILLGWYFGARLVVLSYPLGDGPLLGMASLH